jgi:hypothetical protein
MEETDDQLPLSALLLYPCRWVLIIPAVYVHFVMWPMRMFSARFMGMYVWVCVCVGAGHIVNRISSDLSVFYL